MTTKEQIKAIIQQYADKGKKMYSETIDSRGSRYNAGFWDGYECCAKGLLRELEDMQEEPVSEGLEQAIDTYLATYFGGEKEKQEWPFLKKMAVHFAEWKKQKDIIPVSEDLEKAARKYAGIPEDSPHDLKYCVQDKKAKYDAVLYGANLQKQQMMKEAVEGVVGEDSGGHLYAYIPLSEDCGLSYLDKVKVLVIKED